MALEGSSRMRYYGVVPYGDLMLTRPDQGISSWGCRVGRSKYVNQDFRLAFLYHNIPLEQDLPDDSLLYHGFGGAFRLHGGP